MNKIKLECYLKKHLSNFLRNSHYNTENDGDRFFSPLETQTVKKCYHSLNPY